MAKQKMKYHRETMKLLGWTSASLRPDEARLAQVETRLAQTLPAAVREWIVYVGDMRFCVGHNQDHAVGLEHLGGLARNEEDALAGRTKRLPAVHRSPVQSGSDVGAESSAR